MVEVSYLAAPVVALLVLALISTQDSWQRTSAATSLWLFTALAAFFLSLLWISFVENLALLALAPLHQTQTLISAPTPLRVAFGVTLGSLAPQALAFILSGGLTSLIFLILLASKPTTILRSAGAALAVLLGAGFVFVTTEYLPAMFVSFELLLLASLYLLRITSKSERVLEAATEMFFWTLFGSAALLSLFAWLYAAGVVFLGQASLRGCLSPFQQGLVLVGFGVKIPVWPFFSWLLKAHVEASVEFSILLSGFIVKVGVCGIFRFLHTATATFATSVLAAACVVGLVVATLQLFAQRDLKRIVALTTVVEMNWLALCLSFGGIVFDTLAAYLVVVHSVTTALEFLVVETISKRYNTRDLTQLAGLWANFPFLGVVAFLVTLVTIGFPLTPLFTAKVLFFAALAPMSPTLALVLALLLLLLLPLFFMRAWVPVWFGLSPLRAQTPDLAGSELLPFAALLVTAIALALFPGLVVSC